jgi:hypothetical protein
MLDEHRTFFITRSFLVRYFAHELSTFIAISAFSILCYRLAWWTKATAFTMADLAFLGVFNGYFGSNLVFNQKVAILAIGLILIPIAFTVSYLSMRKVSHAGMWEWLRLVDWFRELDRGLHDGLNRDSSQPAPSPLMTEQSARELVIARVRSERDSPPPAEEVRLTLVETAGEAFHFRGTQPLPTIAGLQTYGFEAWVNRRDGTCRINHLP